jgi:uncharacterized protein (DUF302 family)
MEEEIGLLLPCNVIVYEKNNKTVVSVFDPMVIKSIIDNPGIQDFTAEIKQRLQRVLENL